MMVPVIPVRIVDAIGDWSNCCGHRKGIQNHGGVSGKGGDLGGRLIDARFVYAINLQFITTRSFRHQFYFAQTAMTATSLNYSGHLHLRHRLVLSVLSGKAIKINKIRPGDKNPGLRGMLSGYCLRGRH
jgi:hypothetical protein